MQQYGWVKEIIRKVHLYICDLFYGNTDSIINEDANGSINIF